MNVFFAAADKLTHRLSQIQFLSSHVCTKILLLLKGLYESNGTGDLFVDPKLPTKSFAHNHNLHYSIGDLIATASRVGHDAKSHMKRFVSEFSFILLSFLSFRAKFVS